MIDKTDDKGKVIEKGKSYNEMVLDNNYHDDVYTIMSELMTTEPSYVRYDHDLKSIDKTIHPVDHFDVNSNKLASFKLGLGGRVSPDKFESYMSPLTKALFCSEGTISIGYQKRITLRDVRKGRKS